MDKRVSILAFAFVIAPFLLAACDDVTPPVSQPDNTNVIEQPANTEDTSAVTDKEDVTPTENGNVSATPEDMDSLVSEMIADLPPFYANSDVNYTVIKEIDADTVMAPYKEEILAIYHDTSYEGATWEHIKSLFQWYEVGDIVGGKYAGQKLLVSNMSCDGMCMYPTIYRFAYDDSTKELTALSAISGETDPASYVDPLLANEDETTKLSGVVLPDDLTLPNGDIISKSMDDAGFRLPGLVEEEMFRDASVGIVYGQTYGLGCLYVLKPDGTLAKYEYDPGFFDDETLEIVWNDGSPNTNVMNNYSYTHNGCGIQGNCYIVDAADMDSLVEVGETTDGTTLYLAKNPLRGADKIDDGSMSDAQQTLDQYYDIYYNYASYDENSPEPVSFEEYVAERPILYWIDPLNRMSSIVKNDFKPAAECGKPVVYLYPEQTEDVSVKVLIDEFTKTVPEHGDNGWMVSASPSGEIYNYADGQTYPYLFWEGHKDGGLNVDQGFVVARDELDSFLPSALSKMGLNDNEIGDFVEFWYPIMTSNSEDYFFISFVGTADFNKVAPLEISPTPDTLIRVFMYYNPVSKPFPVQEQNLRSIPRNGFTVVEWGGTSSRPWVNQE